MSAAVHLSRIPAFYRPPMGLPLYWRDEQSGELAAAVTAYFNDCLGKGTCEGAQLSLVIDYCHHFIHAPCWENNPAVVDEDRLEYLGELRALRVRSTELASVESIRRWTEECMELALDPF